MTEPTKAPLTDADLREITEYAAGYLGGKVRRYFDLLAGEVNRLRAELDDPKYQYAGSRIQRAAIECRNDEIDWLYKQIRDLAVASGFSTGGGTGAKCEHLLAHVAGLVKAEAAADAEVERLTRQFDRFQEALTWAVGFIRCNLPKTSERYEDMRNAEDLVRDDPLWTGEFQMASIRAEVMEEQLDTYGERHLALEAAQEEAEHTIEALRAALAATEGHAAELQRFIIDPEKVVLEREQDGSATATVQHLAVRAFAASFARTLGDAPNFVTMELQAEVGSFVVTVRRGEGKSPAQVLTEMREERDAARRDYEHHLLGCAAQAEQLQSAGLVEEEPEGSGLYRNARAERAEAEVARLKKLLDRDHTGLAQALNACRQAIRGYGWIPAGEWGCYEYHERTEEALRQEVGRAFDEVERVAELALRESGDRALAAFYPDKDQLAAVTAERDQLKAAVAEHHAQKADDRCIEDDDKLYAAAGLPPCDRRVGDKAAMLENCKRFIENRCADGGWPTYRELEAERDRLKAELSLERQRADLEAENYERCAELREQDGRAAAEYVKGLAEELGCLRAGLVAFRQRIEEERRDKWPWWSQQTGTFALAEVLKWLDEALAATAKEEPCAPPKTPS